MNKRIAILVLVLSGLLSGPVRAQETDPVLMTVGDRVITASQFMSAYRKNNIDMKVADPKSVREYLDLYIDFNLKVVEAMSQGLDTQPEFLSELEQYRRQLARPYFSDESITGHLVEEAWQRMQYDIRASHILLGLEEHALPSDTLRVYNRLMEIRERHLQGEDFGDLAETYSEDPSARGVPPGENNPGRPGNRGDLGYFTVFNMVYPFESAAYNTPVGEVSLPVRTRFGYHLVKVSDRLPAMGTARVAHIMTMTPPGGDEQLLEDAGRRIQEAYEALRQGMAFEDVAARYSEDQSTVARGGEMPPFQSNRIVPEFVEAIHGLDSPGDYTPPVRSQYGWHIIRLIDRTPPAAALEDVREELKERVTRDARSQLSQAAVVDRLKEQYGFGEDLAALHAFYELADEEFLRGEDPRGLWEALDQPLFWFAGVTVTQQEFAAYLRSRYAPRLRPDPRNLVNESYSSYVSERLIRYEEQFLEEKHPEFRAVMQEYHDGILLFELTDREVWSRAMEDTLGLHAFFEQHRDDYHWDERMELTIYQAREREAAGSARAFLEGRQKNAYDSELTREVIEAVGNAQLSAQHRLFERGDHPVTDKVDWAPGLYGPFLLNGSHLLVHVHGIQAPRPQEFREVRGLVVADYQNHLEREWVAKLRNRYEVVVDYPLLETLQP
jgi:peptidyl-prolyl cis-trans isomerase SurA